MPCRERGERLLIGALGSGDPDEPDLVERTVARLHQVAAIRYAEIEVRAADDRRVALPRIVGPLEHADAAHHLGDYEVRVGVTLTLHVHRAVDRYVADAHLDARSVLQVESAQ